MNIWKKVAILGALGVAVMSGLVAGHVPGARANPHSGQSLDVGIIGSADVTNGGELIVTGPPGGLGDFVFTDLGPADVNSANLAAFDTAVLNVASNELDCDVDVLSTDAKDDLVGFVQGGGKLVIYDSECDPQDYGWLPYPFSTNNPGAAGAQGTLTIVENNVLASDDPGNTHFIHADGLGSESDAVGDMNVMVTFDPNWCLSMSGTNRNEVTGPVHAYARYGTGLIIYNGLDVDDMGDESSPPYPDGLEKIWLQELQAPLRASAADLPCGVTIVGLALVPVSAENPVGTSHTVTARLTDLLGDPREGVEVSFEVVSGPNAGASGDCDPSNCTSSVGGEVDFTYDSNGSVGTDEIVACVVAQASAVESLQDGELCSAIVTKTWKGDSGSKPKPKATATPCIPPLIGYRCDTHSGGSQPQPTEAPAESPTPVVSVLPATVAPQPTPRSGVVVSAPDTGDGSGTGGTGSALPALVAMAIAGLATLGGGLTLARRRA